MTNKVPIAVANGDGIGPEIMAATLHILEQAGAQIDIHPVQIGEKVYLSGQSTGMEPSTWEILRHTKAFLKAPISTPQGGGFKSLNVTIRTTLGLYANVRPCVAYYPFVKTKHPGMDVIIIRENEEDLYTGIEYRQSNEVYQALKIITRPGCERIIRYAFEYAQAYGRRKVTCFTKDNILKFTDGLFHKIFEEIGQEYPHLEQEHWIVDIGAAKLADTPTAFDVVVLPNLYGDILSDVAAQIAGSVGLAGSANIGTSGAMFEAIHGSAPRRAGQNSANPSGLLLAAIQMLVHIGQAKVASNIHNAWLATLEDGIHTYDIFKEPTSKQQVGTKEFADAVIQRLGKQPHTLPSIHYGENKLLHLNKVSNPVDSIKDKTLTGADLFIEWHATVDELAQTLLNLSPPSLKLQMINNRGARVWPEKHLETACVDIWRCRFIQSEEQAIQAKDIINILEILTLHQIHLVQIHYLFKFDGKPGYPLSPDEQ